MTTTKRRRSPWVISTTTEINGKDVIDNMSLATFCAQVVEQFAAMAVDDDDQLRVSGRSGLRRLAHDYARLAAMELNRAPPDVTRETMAALQTHGTQAAAAEELGIDVRTLQRRLTRIGKQRRRVRSTAD